MGRAALPEINSVVEVLELITNPEKYITYLKEFRRIHKDAQDALGLVDTKDKMDVLVASTHEAVRTLAEQKAKFAEESKYRIDAFHKRDEEFCDSVAKFHIMREEFEKYVAREKAEVGKMYAEADATEKKRAAAYDRLFKAVEDKNAELTAKQEQLDAIKAKIAPVAAALGVSLE